MAEPIKAADMAKVLDIDFVNQFEQGINQLVNLLGIAEPEVLHAGHQIQQYEITGKLEDGAVAEGSEIPVSNYKIAKTEAHVVDLKQYRKQTTKQAILKSGYENAMSKTDHKMVRDVQGTIRKSLFDFLAAGTGKATGATFQAAFAAAWGELANELSKLDTAGTPVFFANPLDLADYLGAANINNVESAFGFTYLQNFLGLGTCVFDANVKRGTVIATPAENINCYAVDLAGLSQAGFDYAVDETGLIGVHHSPKYENGTAETYADTGVLLFPEVKNFIVKSTISAPTSK